MGFLKVLEISLAANSAFLNKVVSVPSESTGSGKIT